MAQCVRPVVSEMPNCWRASNVTFGDYDTGSVSNVSQTAASKVITAYWVDWKMFGKVQQLTKAQDQSKKPPVIEANCGIEKEYHRSQNDCRAQIASAGSSIHD